MGVLADEHCIAMRQRFGTITYYQLHHTTLSISSFNINPSTGNVTVARPLDFETRAIYELDVTAQDNGGLSTTVRFVITVLDFNDQGPVFTADQYSAFVDEGTNVLNPAIVVSVSRITRKCLLYVGFCAFSYTKTPQLKHQNYVSREKLTFKYRRML